jgi:hypothetical protein
MTDAERNLLALLRATAADGKTCPTNVELAERLGLASPSKCSEMVTALAKAGHIIVERGPNSRVVHIVGTDLRTAGAIKQPHWRDTEAGQARAAELKAEAKAHPRSYRQKPVCLPAEPQRPEQSAALAAAARACAPDDVLQLAHGEASRLGLTTQQFLARLLHLGWQTHEAQRA